MTPEERTQFNEMKKLLERMRQGEDIVFVENIKRRLDVKGEIRKTRINDLLNVNDTGITNGQLLKWDSSENQYLPANDIDT